MLKKSFSTYDIHYILSNQNAFNQIDNNFKYNTYIDKCIIRIVDCSLK